jgi:hypothetical protein
MVIVLSEPVRPDSGPKCIRPQVPEGRVRHGKEPLDEPLAECSKYLGWFCPWSLDGRGASPAEKDAQRDDKADSPTSQQEPVIQKGFNRGAEDDETLNSRASPVRELRSVVAETVTDAVLDVPVSRSIPGEFSIDSVYLRRCSHNDVGQRWSNGCPIIRG